MLRNLVLIVLMGAAFLWHARRLQDVWETASEESHARDFASYFYATRVAAAGGNPYSKAELSAAARKEGTRRHVFPYLYPPAFLVAMTWTLPLELGSAYRLWFWICELFTWLAALILLVWWRRAGASVICIAIPFCLSAALTHNHLMGQINLAVLAIMLAGAWQVERGRPQWGGALVGVACMMKMSPVLLLAWWALRGYWRALGAAIASGLVLSIAAMSLGGLSPSIHFLRDVVPGFLSDDYYQLRVPIGLFGNHSLANIVHQLVPGTRDALSSLGLAISVTIGIAVVAVTARSFRRPPADDLATAGQVSAVMAAMLLIPLYTYEHHLVWALPAMVVSAIALWQHRVDRGWSVPLAFSLVAGAVDLQDLKWLAHRSGEIGPWLATAVRESKTVAILILWVIAVQVGRSDARSPANPMSRPEKSR